MTVKDISLPGIPSSSIIDPEPPAPEPPEAACVRHIACETEVGDNHVAAFSPDGRLLAIGAETNTVLLVDPLTGKVRRRLGENCSLWISCVTALSFSADGRRLASNGRRVDGFDREITIWDLDKERYSSIRVGTSEVTALALSPDGDRVALGFCNGTIELRDAGTGQEIFTLRIARAATEISRLAFGPDGSTLLSDGDWPESADIRDAATGMRIRTISGKLIGVLADGRAVTSVLAKDKTGIWSWLCMWDARTGTFLDRVRRSELGTLVAAKQPRSIVVRENRSEVWNWESDELLAVLDGVTATAVSADGSMIAAGTEVFRVD